MLDTWFSSGLWPFSTLGWPDDTADLRAYYPTTLLITGFDILFFWVARMIMMGLELTGEVPFRQVHIHGLVRDAGKQKMSKTKGNVVDPLEITEKYGTDAFRMALLLSAGAGSDIVYSEDRVVSARAFANKIWNASRLIFLNMEASQVAPRIPAAADPETLEDRWIWSRLGRAAEEANLGFEQHRYHESADRLWHSFWDEFCDWYLEIKKLRLTPDSGATPDWTQLLNVFAAFLRLLHPVMPFITEELWHRLGREDSIALAPYPKAENFDEAAEREMALLQEMITAARAIRADRNIDKKLLLNGRLYCRNGALAIAHNHLAIVQKLANVNLVAGGDAPAKLEGAVRSTPDFDLVLETPPADVEGQRARLAKEIQRLNKLIEDQDRQLGNERFLSGAPAEIVDGLKLKRSEYLAQLGKSREALENLK